MERHNPKGLIILGIVIFIIECIVAYCLIGYRNYSESLYFITQALNCIVVAFGVIYAAWQYYQTSDDSRRNTDLIRVQKAIDLAQFYKDNILEKYMPIRYIFDESKISGILSKVPVSNMKYFDSKELKQFISDGDILRLRELQYSDSFFNALLDANVVYDMGFKVNKEILSVKENADKTHSIKYRINKEPIITAFMRYYVNDTLNNMEFFAMHFSHNAADSSVVYQSLHQSYIEMVEALYYFIAIMNTDSIDKFYTNVISLYGKWKDERLRRDEKQKEHEHELQNRGTVIK